MNYPDDFHLKSAINSLKTDWKRYFLLPNRYKRIERINSSLLLKIKEAKKKEKRIFPNPGDIFAAFNYFNLRDTKIIIIGQDPYQTYNKKNGAPNACGLAFLVKGGTRPSIKNIIKVIDSPNIKTSEDLFNITSKGILWLNTVLTVEESKSNSHKNILGWESLTSSIIKLVSKKTNNSVFMLFGNEAQKKEELINSTRHKIIKTSHPSPYSAKYGFLSSNCFNEADQYLKENGRKPIFIH